MYTVQSIQLWIDPYKIQVEGCSIPVGHAGTVVIGPNQAFLQVIRKLTAKRTEIFSETERFFAETLF